MNYDENRTGRRQLPAQLVLMVAIAIAVGACSKEAPPPAQGDQPTATAPAAEQPAAPVVTDSLTGLSSEELRTAASTAYRESRLYAPAGDNAIEYYIALREKQPGDAGVSSALIDLLPMTVIATEQSRDREDFEEARRLLGLVERADEKHPALPRLKQTLAAAEAEAAQRAEQQRLTAEEQARRQQELAAEREQQQREAQAEAARQLAEQESAAQQEAARQEAARQEAARQEAARQEAARQEAARQEAARQEAARRAAAVPAAAPAQQLRAISTPAPRFPPEALRAGTSGEVQVEFTVGVDGSVTNARVVRADPPRVFDREALAAVRRWRFEPVSEPVTSRRTIGFQPGN